MFGEPVCEFESHHSVGKRPRCPSSVHVASEGFEERKHGSFLKALW